MLLFLITLVVIPILPGMCMIRIFNKRNSRPCPGILHAYVIGLLLCLVLCGAVNGVSVLLHKSLEECAVWYCLTVLWVQLLSAILLMLLWRPEEVSLGNKIRSMGTEAWSVVKGLPEKCRSNPLCLVIYGGFAVLVFLQIMGICNKGYVYLAGDMTLETVQSFLEHNALHQVHPLTGMPYEAGVPLRIQILCLPTLYATVCRVFQLTPQMVVWTVMPIYFLLCSYLVYYLLGRCLFREKALYRGYFLILVALLVGWGTYGYGMDGLGLLYRGFRGESIRAGILLPYVLCQVLQHKWWSVLLCVCAELFVVWTLYGMGSCLFVAVGFLIIALVRKDFTDKSGKEASVCGK